MLICLFWWGYISIHPEDKQDVAYRLVLGARAVAYGEKNVSFQGPFPTHAVLKQDFICIEFNQGINAINGDGFFEVRSHSFNLIKETVWRQNASFERTLTNW